MALFGIASLSTFAMTTLFGYYGEPIAAIVWLSIIGVLAGMIAAVISWFFSLTNLATVAIASYDITLALTLIGYSFYVPGDYSYFSSRIILSTIVASGCAWLFLRWLSINISGLK